MDNAINKPGLFYLLLETRGFGEFLSYLALRPLLNRIERGDGHPVIVIPGFGAGDMATLSMRKFLGILGYDVSLV